MEPEEPTGTESSAVSSKTFWITVKKKVSSLKFHPKNPRIITEDSIDSMQTSIAEFGYADPILANLNDVIIAGHKRASALLDWGLDDEEIEVRVPNRLLSEEEHEKFMLMHNHIGDNSWNWDTLNNEFSESMLASAGFTEDQLAGFAKADLDVELEEPKDPTTKEPKQATCPNCQHTFEI